MFKYILVAALVLAGCRGSYQTTHQCNGYVVDVYVLSPSGHIGRGLVTLVSAGVEYNVWEVSQEASAAIARQRRTARATACEIVRDARRN